jgi:Protein of unknown function (DUF3465)
VRRLRPIAFAAAVLAMAACQEQGSEALVPAATGGDSSTTASDPDSLTSIAVMDSLFSAEADGFQVKQRGAIRRILADDTSGSRHQRLIVAMRNGQTLLLAHNIDLAPRIPSPSLGDTVVFFGEYHWNAEGGTVDWTHRDPAGIHVDGWLEHGGSRYQ